MRDAHNHSGHAHGHVHVQEVSEGNERRVFWMMWLTGGFMIAQVIGGLLSGSLALLADAAHMLSDTAALALAWVAFRVARRPPSDAKSYGWHRFEILAAFVNGAGLIVLAVWIVYEAIQRLMAPSPVLGGPMLVVAALGLVVNIVAFAVLSRGSRTNVNLRGALLHVVGDLLGSVAAIAAAVVILWTGWYPIDPLLSVLVAALILRSAGALVRDSAHILLEGTPEHIDPQDVKAVLAASIPEVLAVHHVHIWSLTVERSLMTLHVTVPDAADRDQVLAEVQRKLKAEFGVHHATVQIESERGCCPD